MKAIQAPGTRAHGGQIWPLSVAAYRALGQTVLIPENTELLYGQVYQKKE